MRTSTLDPPGVAPVAVRQDASRSAGRLLEHTWGDALPVDPVRIARNLGINVFHAELEPNVSGALVKERGQDPSIVLNAADSPNRKRFTCAHELGHFVRRTEQLDKYEYVDYRDQLSAAGTDDDETYANAFAASLLMPEHHVRRLHRSGMSDLEMALRFDVSREAMQYRLQGLQLQ